MVERPQVVNRDVAVELVDDLPDRSEGGGRQQGSPDVHHGGAREIVLQKRKKHLPRHLVAHTCILRVLHDTHDLNRGLGSWIGAEPDVPAKWAATSKVVSGITVVHD